MRLTPVITSNSGEFIVNISIPENTSFVNRLTWEADVPPADGSWAETYFTPFVGADMAIFGRLWQALDGASNRLFGSGVLTFGLNAPDFEAPADANRDNVYEISVGLITNGALLPVATQFFRITVTDVNESPRFNGPSMFSVSENTTVVATIGANDPDAGTTLTYSLSGGNDSQFFDINSATGALTFRSPRDFETPANVRRDNIYEVGIQISDGTLTARQSVFVTVTNVNEAPVITSPVGGLGFDFSTGQIIPVQTVSVSESTRAVTTITATDSDAGTALRYTIVAGGDSGKLQINTNTGELSFVFLQNFEAPGSVAGTNTYSVKVRVSDGVLFDDHVVVINLTNANEAPVITSNGAGTAAAISIAENTRTVTTVTAADPDAEAVITYSISGGADSARFAIEAGTGKLSFITAPNFEGPSDTGANNVYDVRVRASDGVTFDDQAIAVTVTNVNERPVFTSNGGGSVATIAVTENTRAVTTVIATDQDPGTRLTYSISPSDGSSPSWPSNVRFLDSFDARKFTIDANTGVLVFNTPPDFETPNGYNGNTYYVGVDVTDGTNYSHQSLVIQVANVAEAPVITSNGGGATATVLFAENGTALTTVRASDSDASTTLAYSITGGADAARFAIDATTGALSFVAAPNFEAPTDAGGNNVYDVTVRASDGTLTDDQTIAVTVTNVAEAPVITTNGGGSFADVVVAENTTALTTVRATGEAGATLTYSILPISSTPFTVSNDGDKFTINPVTGALSFITAPNFEAPGDFFLADNIYDVYVAVSDGVRETRQQLKVQVTNVNESAPVIGSNGGGASAAISLAENGTAVTTVVATDADAGSNVVYAITGGADANKFAINAVTGALSFIVPPNFEARADSGGNNVYDLIVSASDGARTDVQSIAVTVTNVNEGGPTILTNGGGFQASTSVTENSTYVTTVVANDADTGQPLTYSIYFGADADKFTINADTGVLAFRKAQDFEAPTDAGGNNVYDLVVRVSDGTMGAIQGIAVTVTDRNEPQVLAAPQPGLPGVVDLATIGTTDGFTILGANSGDSAGFSVASAGDFNGDGYSDVIVGAPLAGGSGFFTGSSYIVFGKAGGFGTINLNAPLLGLTDFFEIEGDAASDFAARSVASAGDVNGDGYSDVIIGAYGVDSGGVNAGAAYVVFGTPNGSQMDLTSLGFNQGFRIIGDARSDFAGISVASAGDINGDGFADITIGANWHDAGGADAGAAYVIFGKPSGFGQIDLGNSLTAGQGFKIIGDVAGDEAGISVASAGDINRDGFADIVIGAHFNDSGGANAGAAYVVFGKATGFGTIDLGAPLAPTAGFKIQGDADTDNAGFSAASAGDVNGDGFADIIIGAAGNDSGGADAGAAYVLYGKASGFGSVDLGTALTTAEGFRILGDANGDGAGISVAAAGDFNGDGFGDVIVGAELNDGAGIDAGAAYVIYGKASGIGTIDLGAPLLATLGFRIQGPAAGSKAGHSVSSAGDLNRDGFADLIIGAPSNGAGAAYVVFGRGPNLAVPVITSNGDTATATISLTENGAAVTTIIATDADPGTRITYSIAGGADQSRFAIDAATGALSFITAPDHEAPSDAGGNNVYDVIVRANDGASSDEQAIAVTVTNINEVPTITANGGGATATITVAENGQTVGSISAIDRDAGAVLTYFIHGGEDSARFRINSINGTLSFIRAPDFEGQSSVNGDQIYEVEVGVTDGALSDVQAISVLVANANEAPVITSNGSGPSASITIDENINAVTTISASDVDAGSAIIYTITGGADAAKFAINSESGMLFFIAAPDFEAPDDFEGVDNVYEVVVRASDGTASGTQTLAISVTDVNEAPTAAPVTLTAIAEGSGARLITAAELLAGTADIDGPALSITAFTLTSGNGTLTDNGDGTWSYTPAANDDTAAAFAYTVSDGSLSASSTANLDLTTVGDAPTAAPVTLTAIAEDSGVRLITAAELLAGTADIDGPALAITAFTLTSGNGTLTDNGDGAWSYTPAANDDTAAAFAYTVSDGSLSASSTASLDLTPVGDAPVITSNGELNTASVNVAENSSAVTTVLANDPDAGTALAYTISGGADAAKFAIDPATGALRFIAAPNFEVPTDAGGDNVYDVIVSASDGSLSDTQAIAVTITDVSEGGGRAVPTEGDDRGATALIGTTGNDTIDGLGGNDQIFGLAGVDTLIGGIGNDELAGGAGADVLNGGIGSDTAYYADALALVRANLTTPSANTGDAAGDVYTSIENLLGSNFSDTLVGNNSSNVLTGGKGNDSIQASGGADTLFGGEGNDVLQGQGGNDRLDGGRGDDSLAGGSGGRDWFNYTGSGWGNDTITDYEANLDEIDFRGSGITLAQLSKVQSGANTVITGTGGTITILNTLAANVILRADAGPAGPTLDINLAGAAVAENSPINTVIGQLSTTTTGPNTSFTYQLVDNAGGRFAISGTQLVVASVSLLDYEQATSRSVSIRVTDGGGNTVVENFAIAVTDVNEAPTAVVLTGALANLAENSAVGAGIKVADVVVTDDALGTNAFSLTGADAASFEIRGTGLYYIGASPDFESKASYAVTVRVDDAGVGTTPDASVNYVLAITDVVEGGPSGPTEGDDRGATAIVGTSGNNVLFGLGGNDQLFGLAGTDTLNGGNDNDELSGGIGADVLNGGDGLDTAVYSTALAGLRADLVTPSRNTGEAAGDTYSSIENLLGSDWNDTLVGNNSANVLTGGKGDDNLQGGGGADRLLGSEGNDTIAGQGGNDVLIGGIGNDSLSGGSSGRDWFTYTGPGWGNDTINDFEDGIDLIDFRGSGLLYSGLQITQQGSAVLVQTADHASSILIQNTLLAQVNASDFLI